MAILLQYNDQMKWTYQQLFDNTGSQLKKNESIAKYLTHLFFFSGISLENLQQIIGILFKARLLECDVDENNLLPDTEITLNTLFKK